MLTMCAVLDFYNLNFYIPLYLFHLHQFQKAVKKVYSDESGRANVIVVGPIPADNTNSGKSSMFRGKGWNFFGNLLCL